MATTTTNTTTTVQQEQNMNALNTGIGQSGMVQEYHLETKTLEPIINKENINYSVNKAILNETNQKFPKFSSRNKSSTKPRAIP